jgi:hypothetical protein
MSAVVKFFEIDKEQECLWDVSSAQSRSKQARGAALLKIMEEIGRPRFVTGEMKQKLACSQLILKNYQRLKNSRNLGLVWKIFTCQH